MYDNLNEEFKNVFDSLDVASVPIVDSPETPYEMVNKYGTYEIQPTAETDNEFPTIAQGLPKKWQKPTVKKVKKTKRKSI